MEEIRQHDVVLVDLTGAVGSEQDKVRYAVVVLNDKGNTHGSTTIIMPLTHQLKALHLPTHAMIKKTAENGLKVDSMLVGEQLRVVSEQRILKKVGTITDENTKSLIKKVYFAVYG